jgi:thymidylate synthase (FAD)
VLDHGEIELIGVMGSDQSIEAAARVSYGGGTRRVHETRGLLRYLMRHNHTSPFEQATLQYRVKCPIFVARQWMRHRTWSFNEVSGRYSELPDEFWQPDNWRGQDPNNKQGSEGIIQYEPEDGHGTLEESCFAEYNYRLASGVSREMARSCLPISTYTEFVGRVDLHNLLKFVHLRGDSHAQREIQEYAHLIEEDISRLFPLTWEAFSDYHINGLTLSKPEQHIIQEKNPMKKAALLDKLSAREQHEFVLKCERLGL